MPDKTESAVLKTGADSGVRGLGYLPVLFHAVLSLLFLQTLILATKKYERRPVPLLPVHHAAHHDGVIAAVVTGFHLTVEIAQYIV